MKRNLTQVAADLNRLANGGSAGERALRDLAARLTQNPQDLVGADLAAKYPPTTMLPGDAEPRGWVHIVELCRDTLVFLPVVYTWWKLSEALREYDTSRSSDPFLLAWQSGFDGRVQPLSASATLVSMVVLAIVALTVVAHFGRARLETRAADRRQRLAVCLADAGLLLDHRPVSGPGVAKDDLLALGSRIGASTAALQKSLGALGTDLAKAVDTGPGSRLHQMFEQWTAAARELREFGNGIKSTQVVVGELRETQTALTAMAQRLGAETERLVKALAAERTQSSQEGHANRDMATEVGASSRLLTDAMRGLTERAEQFQELVLRLAYIIENLEGNDGGAPAMSGGYHV